MTALRAIPVPIEAVRSRADWARRVRESWPNAEAWFVATMARLLSDRRSDADTLLVLADALEEARSEANLDGQLMKAAGLAAVADLARRLAPHRAEG